MRFWLIAGGLYLLAVIVCGAFIFWDTSSTHKEPL